MRVFLSCDMEGVTGVVHFGQVTKSNPEYEMGRSMQLHDVLAVVRAAVEEGATRVLVNDAHESMSNLDVRAFPREAELVSGSPKNLCMVEGVGECDVAIFVGYHAMAGTERAVMDHTMSTISIFDVRLNGRPVGETGINAALCGALGVPVALVTGDEALCLETGSLLPEAVTCAVKEGHGRFAARILSPETTAERIRAATRDALSRFRQGKLSPWCPESPYRFEVTFYKTQQCDAASLVPHCRRTSGRTLLIEHEDFLEAYRAFMSAVFLGDSMP